MIRAATRLQGPARLVIREELIVQGVQRHMAVVLEVGLSSKEPGGLYPPAQGREDYIKNQLDSADEGDQVFMFAGALDHHPQLVLWTTAGGDQRVANTLEPGAPDERETGRHGGGCLHIGRVSVGVLIFESHLFRGLAGIVLDHFGYIARRDGMTVID